LVKVIAVSGQPGLHLVGAGYAIGIGRYGRGYRARVG
jgi:hypothetical protein